MSEAFFVQTGPDTYQPTPAATGPWSRELMHGSPPSALLCHLATTQFARTDVRVSKVGVEFLGPLHAAELRAEVRMLRPGKRVELLEGTLTGAGRPVLSVRIWRMAEQTAGAVPPVVHEAPPAPLPAAIPARYFGDIEPWGYGAALEWRFTAGGFNTIGPGAVWVRPTIPLLAGQSLTPLVRLLLVADSANGLSAELPLDRWLFVPTSLSLALLRGPEGEWVHMAATTSLDAAGFGVVEARFADANGLVGVGQQSLFVQAQA